MSKLSCLILLVLGLSQKCKGFVYQESLDVEDLYSLFGEEECIEGSLSVSESGDPVIKSVDYVSAVQSPVSTSKRQEKNETVSEKSPMSLLYELAEFNKVEVQFVLTDEKGPAHKKQFVVSLKLGEEEYVGEGGSIKKAQHEASRLALNSTLYGHPPKQIKNKVVFENSKTPVQKLENWARKHNDATVFYSFYEQTKLMDNGLHANYYHSGMYSRANNIHKVKVKVENKYFTGEGASLDIAKQRAASNALESLQSVDGFCMLTDREKSFFNKMFDSDNDSPISLVHEFGTISNMPVSFDLYSEEGPAHIKKFVYRCNVGDSFETFGEGSSKKIAKKEAAENMIKELKRHSTFNRINCGESPRKSKSKKKKSKNLIKSVTKTYLEEEEETNHPELLIPEELDPVSKLYQIQQAKHGVLPVFTLLDKSNKEFIIEVTVNDLTAIGSGPNKKASKKKAAQAMLEKMGYSATRKNNHSSSQNKKNDFSEGKGTFKKKSIAPGINLNSNKFHKIENTDKFADNLDKSQYRNTDSADNHKQSELKNKNNKIHKLEDNLGKNNELQSKDALQNEDPKSKAQKKTDFKPKLKLLNLSEQLGFKFQFSDFPRMNSSGFISLVSLTTDPPKVCYGVGESSDRAQDKAALSALGTLYKSEINHISQLLREENTASPIKTEITMIEENNDVRSGAARETE